MNTRSITSVTLILIGNMLVIYNRIGSGWIGTIITIFGLILFFVGLSQLKDYLDAMGQKGVKQLVLSSILSLIAVVLGYIPLLGTIPAMLLNLVAFFMQIIGLLNLKKDTHLGAKGSSGITLLLVAMGIMVLAGLFDLIPFIGGFVTAFIALVAFIITPFGWLRIQEALLAVNSNQN